MELYLEEIGTTDHSTASQLFVDRRAFCFVVEDGYNEEKIAGKTRIPAGRYQVIKRFHGKKYEEYKRKFNHKYALEIANVPNYTNVLLHIGNTIKDTLGCPLVNRNIGINPITGDYQGSDSSSVYRALYLIVDAAFERGEECWIEIQRREVLTVDTPQG